MCKSLTPKPYIGLNYSSKEKRKMPELGKVLERRKVGSIEPVIGRSSIMKELESDSSSDSENMEYDFCNLVQMYV